MTAAMKVAILRAHGDYPLIDGHGRVLVKDASTGHVWKPVSDDYVRQLVDAAAVTP